jgi:hypothetical protein
MTTSTDTARSDAQAKMISIRAMVAAMEMDWETYKALSDERKELVESVEEAESDEQSGAAVDAVAQWDAEYGEDFAQMVETAAHFFSQEQAIEAIGAEALSVEVRSDWHDPSDDCTPGEFRIVLHTNGAPVHVRGEFDEEGKPYRAWMMYQTSAFKMAERVNNTGDMAFLIAFARQVLVAE